jgi:Phytanoyl-CoA dioxygenase (PhyH)
MNEQVRFYPNIDYRRHPAFRDLGIPGRKDDSVVDQMISEIDRDLEALHRTHHPDMSALRVAFESGPGQQIGRLAIYLDQTTLDQRVKEFLKRSFVDVRSELLEEARIKNDRHVSNHTPSPQGRAVAENLKQNGVHICRLEDAERAELLRLCGRVIARLREAAAKDPQTRVAESLPRYSTAGVRLDRYFRRSGVLEGLTSYFGSNVTFTGFALEFSHKDQTWWEGLYAEVGLANPKTAYMHYDHGCRNPKAIVALSDVTEENGPTGYVMGSHKKPRSNFVHFMIKSMDQCFEDDDLAGAKTPYRRRFQEARYRREFLMLPTALQACSHFGEDITDDTQISADLLANEIKITREVGNCVVFDGDYGIHRGALVKSGERLVFQVVFGVEPGIPRSTALKQRARSLARSLIKGN